jgi:adenylyl- and sulfurtransferase ThiI
VNQWENYTHNYSEILKNMHTREELEHKLKETIKESQEEIKKQQQERDAKTTITEDTKEMQGSRADVDHMPM